MAMEYLSAALEFLSAEYRFSTKLVLTVISCFITPDKNYRTNLINDQYSMIILNIWRHEGLPMQDRKPIGETFPYYSIGVIAIRNQRIITTLTNFLVRKRII